MCGSQYVIREPETKYTRQDLQTKCLQHGCVQFQTHMTLKCLKLHVNSYVSTICSLVCGTAEEKGTTNTAGDIANALNSKSLEPHSKRTYESYESGKKYRK